MKKLFIGLCVCVLSGCNTINSEITSDTKSTTPEIDFIKMIEQQNEIQNKYFELCEYVGNQEYPDLLPNVIYKNVRMLCRKNV